MIDPNQASPQSSVVSIESDAETSAPTSYASLAGRIFGWTNNFLFSAVILVVVLVGGRQLISLWQPGDANQSTAATMAWPTFESCAIEFSNQPYQLTRLRLRASPARLNQELVRQCRTVLEQSPQPAKLPTASELKMLASLRDVSPVEQRPGDWRIFSGQNTSTRLANEEAADLAQSHSEQLGLPLVIGIRDNSTGEHPSRMVVWAMAMEDSRPDSSNDPANDFANAGETDWTIFVCQSTIEADKNSETRHPFPIPPTSRRTLAVSDPAGGRLIGFSGGEAQSAMKFFSQWAEAHQWKPDPDWQNVGGNWQACFHKTPTRNSHETKTQQVRVQISSESENDLLGLMIIEPE